MLLELEQPGETYQPDLPPYNNINVIPNSTIYNITGAQFVSDVCTTYNEIVHGGKIFLNCQPEKLPNYSYRN